LEMGSCGDERRIPIRTHTLVGLFCLKTTALSLVLFIQASLSLAPPLLLQ
jgi:hypothetical protein